MQENEEISYTFKGNWENDKPNGEGSSKYIEKGEVDADTVIECEITSSFKDGLVNGQVNEKLTNSDGEVVIFNYSAVEGISPEDTSLKKNGDNNEYTVGVAENNKKHYRVWGY